MNDQNYFVMPDNSNIKPTTNTNTGFAAPTSPAQPPRPAVQPTPSVQPQQAPVQPQQPAKPVPSSFEAPKAPQPSGATFDYNQLYGNKTAKVEEKQAFVFEEPSINTSATVVTEEPTITISNDELIPEFDASVLEVIPEQEKKNISANQEEAKVNTMATGKQAEQDKSRSNVIFIAILFGVILLSVFFLFPMIVKM